MENEIQSVVMHDPRQTLNRWGYTDSEQRRGAFASPRMGEWHEATFRVEILPHKERRIQETSKSKDIEMASADESADGIRGRQRRFRQIVSVFLVIACILLLTIPSIMRHGSERMHFTHVEHIHSFFAHEQEVVNHHGANGRWDDAAQRVDVSKSAAFGGGYGGSKRKIGGVKWPSRGVLVMQGAEIKSSCRHTVRAPSYVADEKGYVCSRGDLNQSGCCQIGRPATQENDLSIVQKNNDTLGSRYSCKTCDLKSGCCGIYEYCVSCCLDPHKSDVWDRLRNSIHMQRYAHGTSFDLCQAACRTSSYSYAGGSELQQSLKHCFYRPS